MLFKGAGYTNNPPPTEPKQDDQLGLESDSGDTEEVAEGGRVEEGMDINSQKEAEKVEEAMENINMIKINLDEKDVEDSQHSLTYQA